MDYGEHVKSCEKIVNSAEFSNLEPVFLSQVNENVNRWMDWFFGFKGKLGDKSYDYSDFSQDHRRERHHAGGILEAGEFVVKMYGEKYRTLGERVAEQHIVDDFGRVPDREEL